jgi:hypothetical protein
MTKALGYFRRLAQNANAGDPADVLHDAHYAAETAASKTPQKTVDLALLRSVTAGTPEQPSPGGQFVREMRDKDRF